MATHSSILAWRIPGTGEPGGLPSMGSHRVGYDWSDLEAAAAATSVWKNSLGISCKEVLVVMNSLNLWFDWEKSLSLLFWRTVFFIYNILGKKYFSFSNLKYHLTLFWAARFLLKNPIIVLWGLSCTWWIVFILLLPIFFWSLTL